MKTALFAASALCLALGSLALPAAAQMPPPTQTPAPLPTDVKQWVTPALQQWQAGEGTFMLDSNARIVVPAGASESARFAADELSRSLVVVGAPKLKVVTGKAKAGDLVLELGDPGVAQASPEAYSLDISDRVTVRATGDAGLFYGTQSVLQMLKYDKARRSLPQGHAADWPNYGMRTMMVDIGRKYYEVNQLDALMREMAWLKLNTLQLHFNDWPAFRLNSPKYPGLAAEQSYDRADVAHLEATAKRYHITIIPEIDMPAHAVALTDYRPSLGFKCEALRRSDWLDRAAGENAKGRAWVIDITREENREWMNGLLEEFIPWFSGPYFHIGGDEYNYDKDKTQCPELVQAAKDRGLQYPGDVFVDWINATDKVVRAHGKTTMIWNWWRFKDDQTSIQPNTDIVIEAWNSPRLQGILADGYKVLISPEDKLYVVPGIANFDGSGYGVVDTKAVYENWPLEKGDQVLGYATALWADAAETRTDQFMLGHAYEPMAVMAERQWSDKGSATFLQFLTRLNRTSAAPRASDTQ